MSEKLRDFVRESNRIEGIMREPTGEEIVAHANFLGRKSIELIHLVSFVQTVAGAPLRDKDGMNVRVGNYSPPPGSPAIRAAVNRILNSIYSGKMQPYAAHVAYEQIHPFMDGNGRSGRVLWAWHMKRTDRDPFSLPFLHRFYYQTLDVSRWTLLNT